jgi:hypothetical protein
VSSFLGDLELLQGPRCGRREINESAFAALTLEHDDQVWMAMVVGGRRGELSRRRRRLIQQRDNVRSENFSMARMMKWLCRAAPIVGARCCPAAGSGRWCAVVGVV